MSQIIRKNNHKKTHAIIGWARMIGVVLLTSILFACSMGVDKQSVCDLKVLSLLIPKQTETAIYGSSAAMEDLQSSQVKLNQALEVVHKNNPNQSGADEMLKDGKAISANIDIIVKNQKNLNDLYDFSLSVAEVIPGIQAEYNLMVDMMARKNYSSMQVVIAKNQVFIAERLLRSLGSMSTNYRDAKYSIDDFLADLETFNAYLQAQLEGNAELGVERVKDPEIRDSLLSIQEDAASILNAKALDLIRNPKPLVAVFQAAEDNMTKSDELFSYLNKLESSTQ